MEKVIEMFVVLVANKVADGYRRAGFSLQKGENTLTVTAEQLVQIKSDPRLAVLNVEPQTQTGENTPKGLSENGEGAEAQRGLDGGTLPADLTVEKLKAKLTELGVEFAGSAKKADLVALLEAALAPKDGE